MIRTLRALGALSMFGFGVLLVMPGCGEEETDDVISGEQEPELTPAAHCSITCTAGVSSLDCPVGRACRCQCDIHGNPVCYCL